MILYLSVVTAVLAIARFLAYWGIYFLKNENITLIKDVLNLTYVENTGAAFGMFSDGTTALSVFGTIIFFVITFLVASKKVTKKSRILPLALLAGGGISNVADRIIFGFVVDYIDFSLINYPVFNFADICVVVGCIWIFISVLTEKEDKTEEKKDF